MKPLTIMNKYLIRLLNPNRVVEQISCNYTDNYYGDKKCRPDRNERL